MILITGAGGFVGQSLLRRLDPTEFPSVCLLSRRELPNLFRCSRVRADLLEPTSYASMMTHVDTVLHLAGLTGKARRGEFFAVNTTATQDLLDVCRRMGVRNFLFVSSIAVKFRQVEKYYYAQSKQAAEQAVARSGLRFTVVRPTPVIGAGGATSSALIRLARLPMIPIFGTGMNFVQPIFVDDLVDALLTVLREQMFDGQTFELGGPEIVTMEELLLKFRHALGLKPTRVVHLPLDLTQTILGRLEPWMLPILPMTAGQLTSFGEDGTITPNRLFQRVAGGMKNLDEMTRLSVASERSQG